MFVPWPNRLVVSSSFFRKRALDHSIATYRREIKVWKRRGSSMVDGQFEFRPSIAEDCLSGHWPSFLFQPLLIAIFRLGCRPNTGASPRHSSRLLLHHWLHRTFWYPPIELFFVGRLRLDDWQEVVGEAEASYNLLPEKDVMLRMNSNPASWLPTRNLWAREAWFFGRTSVLWKSFPNFKLFSY